MLKQIKALYKKEPALVTGILTGLVVAVAGRLGVAIDIDNFNEFLSVVLAGGGAGALIRGQVTPNEDVAVRADEGAGPEHPADGAHTPLSEIHEPNETDYKLAEEIGPEEDQ